MRIDTKNLVITALLACLALPVFAQGYVRLIGGNQGSATPAPASASNPLPVQLSDGSAAISASNPLPAGGRLAVAEIELTLSGSAGAATATAYSSAITGRVVRTQYVHDNFAATTDLVVTEEGANTAADCVETFLTINDLTSSKDLSPAYQTGIKVDGGLDSQNGFGVFVYNERIKAVASSGDDGNHGTVRIYYVPM